MQQTLQGSRERGMTYYLLLILSFFAMIDYILRSTVGHLPVLSSIVPMWKEILIVLLYVAFYLKSKKAGRFDWKASRLHWLILSTFAAAVISGLSNWIIHPYTLDIHLHTHYIWVPLHLPLGAFIEGVRSLLEPTLYFLVLNALVDDEETLQDMIHALLTSAFFIAAFGVYQKAAGWETPKSWVYSEAESNIKIRVFSSIGNPNALGGLMVLTTPIAVAMTLWAKTWAKRFLYGIPALIMAACLVLTYSRGAWLGFLAGMVIYTILTRNKWLAAVGVLGLIAAPFVAHNVVERLTLAFTPEYWNKSAHAGRIEFWHRAVTIWMRYPIFGAGIGGVGDTVATRYSLPGATWIDNQYVRVLAETGAVGILSYVAMLLTPVITGFKAVFGSKQRGTFLFALNAGLVSAIFGMIVENFTAGIFENLICHTTFWTLVALLYVGIRLAKAKSNA